MNNSTRVEVSYVDNIQLFYCFPLTLCACGNESVTIISIHRWTNQAIIIQTRYTNNYWYIASDISE